MVLRSSWWTGLAAAAAVCGAGAYWACGNRVDATSAHIARVNSQELASIKAEFNHAASTTRLILLLSPT